MLSCESRKKKGLLARTTQGRARKGERSHYQAAKQIGSSPYWTTNYKSQSTHKGKRYGRGRKKWGGRKEALITFWYERERERDA